MATNPDIATLLRQRELMGGMNNINPQQNFATQAAGAASGGVQPAPISQFDDTSGGSQATSTGVQQQNSKGNMAARQALSAALTGGAGGVMGALSKVPGLSQAIQAKQKLGQGLQGLMTGKPPQQPPAIQGPPALAPNAPTPQVQLAPDGTVIVNTGQVQPPPQLPPSLSMMGQFQPNQNNQ